MELKIKFPTSLDEIPLKSYVEFMKVKESSNDEEFIAHKFLSIFLGLNLKDTMTIKAKDVNRLVPKLTEVLNQKANFVNRFKLGGVEYGFIPNLDEMSWGEYIDVEGNLFDWEKYHIALSVLYRPIVETELDTYKIQEYEPNESAQEVMRFAPLSVALGASFFLFSLEKELLNYILDFISKEWKMANKTQDMKSSAQDQSLTKSGDGIIQYIESVKETYCDLIQRQDYLYIKHLPSYSMKSKRQKLKNKNLKEA